MSWLARFLTIFSVLLCFSVVTSAQSRRKVVIDQDAAGPGGTDMQAILAIVNSPDTDVLGITVPTGDAWRDEEVLHTLRLMEILAAPTSPWFPAQSSRWSTARNTWRDGRRTTAR